MRLQTTLSIPILMLGAVMIAGCASSPTPPPLNFGDMSPGNLRYQSETRRSAGDLDQALIYAEKLIELHSTEAREQQASLSDYPPTKDAYSYGALNGVGVAYLIKAEILMEKGDKAGARAAYNTLSRDFSYAQYQDGRHDWYKAGEVAMKRLEELKADPG
jgi:hypothetical protein